MVWRPPDAQTRCPGCGVILGRPHAEWCERVLALAEKMDGCSSEDGEEVATFNKVGGELMHRLRRQRDQAQKRAEDLSMRLVAWNVDIADRRRWEEEMREFSAAARDYSLAITHLEDCLTRYNSARYHERGTWQRRDPDAP